MIIFISDRMKWEARESSIEVLKNLKDKPNYTGLSAKDRYYIGFLGELVFKEYLDREGKKYNYNVRLDGRSGGADFELFTSDVNVKVIDVKTASKFYYTKMLVPKVQLDKHPNYTYVGVRLDEANSEGEICGYCYAEDFGISDGFTKEKIPTAYKNFNGLEEIENLISDVIDIEPTNNYD